MLIQREMFARIREADRLFIQSALIFESECAVPDFDKRQAVDTIFARPRAGGPNGGLRKFFEQLLAVSQGLNGFLIDAAEFFEYAVQGS